MATTVGHWKRDSDCDVYIGRPSPWGNPFRVGKDGTRAEVLAKYEAWLREQPELLARARAELRGKKLGCWCAPKRCHGEILAKYIDRAPKILVTGDREWRDAGVVERELRKFPRGTVLVHGKAPGADTIAADIGRRLGFVVRGYGAKWKTEGLLAGSNRNARMLSREHPDENGDRIDVVLAFHDDLTKSKGTRDMIAKAKLANIEVKLFASDAGADVARKGTKPAPSAPAPQSVAPALRFVKCKCGIVLVDSLVRREGGVCVRCRSPIDLTGESSVVPIKPAATEAPRREQLPGASVQSGSASTSIEKIVPQSLPLYDPRACGADCDHCPLNGRPVVPPTPPVDLSNVDGIVVGMNPGHEEERQRRPFVGQSGRLFDRMLNKFGVQRERLHITNAWLCRHKNDEEAAAAMKCCQPRLLKEIETYRKSVPVLMFGREAFHATYGKKSPITKARGFAWSKDDRDYFPTIHPAFVLRDKVQTPLLSRDMRRFAKRIELGYLPLERPRWEYKTHVPRSVERLKELLEEFGDGAVSCDIETTEEGPTVATLLCIGISNGRSTIVVPWQREFKAPLRDFFKGRQTVFHNGFSFDTIVLTRYGIVVDKAEDTLIAHHTYASHFRQGLDHLASFYLDTIPWKLLYGKAAGDEKGVAKDQDEETFYLYNAYDAHLTFRIWEEMQNDLAPWNKLYRHDKKLAVVCRHMTRSGVKVDMARRQTLIDQITVKEERLLAQMREACMRPGFEPTKVDDIRDILFEQFQAPVIERTEKSNKPSTGKKILQWFAATEGRPYSNFCKWLVEWRACTKMKKTYLVNLNIESDGRVRPSWRSFGAYTGRFAARKPNLMNLKRFDKRYKDEPEQHIRSIYVPSDGHCFVTYDMSQVEPRVAAYISGDPAFINAIESGDFHTSNAIVIFGPLPELLDLKRAKDGDGKPKRDVAKSCGLAVNYMAEAETLKDFLAAQGYMIKLSVAQDMINKLRAAYHVYFKFVQTNVECVQKNGWLQIGMLSGRIRWLGFAPSPSSVADTPIQATAADVMNNRLLAIYKALRRRGYFKKGVKIVAQIHDAVIFDVPLHLKEKIKTLIKKKMSKKFVIKGKEIVFPIDMKEGDRWSAL